MGNRRDDDAFREAVAGVQPIPAPRRTRLAARPPAPVPLQSRRAEREALQESIETPIGPDAGLETGEEPVYLRAGVPRLTLRRLRRGHWTVQASLDLHGLNRSDAAAATAEFLLACSAQSLRCVRIVHGRGLGSKDGIPVLKQVVAKMLPRRDEVLAFCQAPAAHGGAGALLVLLKTARR